jgi:hypothetical protein
VGNGNEFLYSKETLCILLGYKIRVLDVYGLSEPLEIDLSNLIPGIKDASSSLESIPEPRISLLSFNEGVLVIHLERQARSSKDDLYVLKTNHDQPNDSRLMGPIELDSSHNIFARNTAQWLYYGTYSGEGGSRHREWLIFGVRLDDPRNQQPFFHPLQLEEFYGTDVGSTIAFEIHDGYFYAVSNQTSFEVEEIDWTSFYICLRFPLDEPKRGKLEVNKKVYRRQHIEGPIHDSWTDLSLQFDERTNKPMIIESRREWQRSSSKQVRSFYISDFKWKLEALNSEAGTPTSEPDLPEDDIYTGVLDSSNRPNYAPEQERFNWNVHPEFAPDCHTTRSFILARTKFRAYNYSCSTFLDLVEDDRCCAASSTASCLRIRVGSRRMAPLDWAQSNASSSTASSSSASPPSPPSNDVAYRNSPIRLWPARSELCPCSQRLHRIMNPPLPSGPIAYTRSIIGICDGRCLVYMIRSGRSYSPGDTAPGVIVVLNFSRGPLPLVADIDGAESHDRASNDSNSDTCWKWKPGACKERKCF